MTSPAGQHGASRFTPITERHFFFVFEFTCLLVTHETEQKLHLEKCTLVLFSIFNRCKMLIVNKDPHISWVTSWILTQLLISYLVKSVDTLKRLLWGRKNVPKHQIQIMVLVYNRSCTVWHLRPFMIDSRCFEKLKHLNNKIWCMLCLINGTEHNCFIETIGG